MDVGSVFITGANRGIGLELVRQLVHLPKPPKFVFATYRNINTTKALQEIADSSKECQVILIKMDIKEPNELEAARKIVEGVVGDNGLNLLVNNAACLEMEGFPDITEDNMLLHFRTNTLGPIAVIKEMLPLFQKAASLQTSGLGVSRATALTISAKGGSISELDEKHPRKWLAAMGYRVSKAALNMAMRIISLEVKDNGILVVMMCPGWVKTDMGTGEALIGVEECVSDILKTCPLLNETHQGSFIERYGKPIPF